VLATTEAQKVLPTVVDRCHRFDFGRPTVEQVARVLGRVAASEQIDIEPGAVALIARHATGSFRDALGTLEQLVTYAGNEQIQSADVLAVLGVADAEQLFEAVDAVQAGDPAQALRTAAKLTASGRDPGQILRDLEIHGRELLAVQVLQEVPEELRITPERDARLLAQAQALPAADVVRLLDLVSGALEATANGAQSRIQLELVLIKAASPEVDPSTAALLARIERLENALRAGSLGPARSPAPQAPPAPDAAFTPEPDPPAPRVERTGRPEPVVTRTTPATEAARAQPQASAAAAQPIPGAPPQAPAAAPGQAELGTLVSSWPAVVELLGKENQLLASSLAAARPVALAGRGLTLAFPTGREFYKRKAEQDDNRRATAEALRTVIGADLTLRYEVRDETELSSEASAGLSHEELVQRLVAEFDAEEVLDDTDQEEGT
jgi:DNA polymerase-3 subunit gamma/tau